MLNYVKGIFSKPTVILNNNTYNNSICFYCGKQLTNSRISVIKEKRFHRNCVKRWYKNNKRSLIYG